MRINNWYNKQFTTNPDKDEKSLNPTALAPLLLRDAPGYWHGHSRLGELKRRIPIVACMLRNTEGMFARILRDLGFASNARPRARLLVTTVRITRSFAF